MASNVTKPPILDETGQEIKGKLSQILTRLPNLKGDKFIAPTPFIYSENEEQVGIWIDGKPLYQKTWDLGSDVSLAAQVWTQISSIVISDYNMDKIISGVVQSSTKESIEALNYSGNTADRLYIFNARNAQFSIRYITLQYTKTTDTAWHGGFKSYGFNPVIYSETEREVGVWIDGKPLYEKTIKSTTTPSANAWNQIALPTGISVKTYCGYYRRSTGAVNKLSAYREDTTPAEMLFDSITNSTYYYRVAAAFITNFQEIDIVIQYTKTTDTAGSGKYTTLGTPTVHYSTNEQVIGTWIDGKTLYQKSFTVASASLSSGELSITTGLSGVSEIVDWKCSFTRDSNGQKYTLPMNRVIETEGIGLTCRVNNDNTVTTNIVVNNGGTAYTAISNIRLTLQYTKTS